MKFNMSKLISLIGYIVSTGVVVSLVPAHYKPLAAVLGSIITGLLHSPLPPDTNTINEIKTSMQLVDATVVALPSNVQAKTAPIIADMNKIGAVMVNPAVNPAVPVTSPAIPVPTPTTVTPTVTPGNY